MTGGSAMDLLEILLPFATSLCISRLYKWRHNLKLLRRPIKL